MWARREKADRHDLDRVGKVSGEAGISAELETRQWQRVD